jgi:phage antirepressor YoqD-like protein
MSRDQFQDDIFDAQVRLAAENMLQQMVKDPKMLSKFLFENTKELAKVTKERDEIAADYSRLTDAEGNYDMKDAAKLLKYKRNDGKQVGRTELFAFLRDLQFLNKNNTPSQSAVDNGWLDEITGTFVAKGVERSYVKTVVTPKGLKRIRRLLEDAFETWWVGE